MRNNPNLISKYWYCDFIVAVPPTPPLGHRSSPVLTYDLDVVGEVDRAEAVPHHTGVVPRVCLLQVRQAESPGRPPTQVSVV